MSDRDHRGLARFVLLTAWSGGLSVAATVLARRILRRRAEREAWARATDVVPPSPADAGR